MSQTLKTISPIDGSVYVERRYASQADIDRALVAARAAQPVWRRTSVAERAAICSLFVEAMERRRDALAKELSWQMGRPIAYAPGEIRGLAERSRFMIGVAESALSDIVPDRIPGFDRFIRREPLGIVLTIAPWNYPYLTAVNSIIPAIMAGNAVILKHSSQTPLCAERFAEGFAEAGLPEGIFTFLHLRDQDTEALIARPEINFVAFTGSVEVGKIVERAAGGRFIGVGLELGGKDAAYVRPDAPMAHTIENLVDGSFFNSGQSCCGIERIYLHRDIHDEFLEGFIALTKQYRLGNPLDPSTTLGPMVRASAADLVRAQIAAAVANGAGALIDESLFPASKPGTPYLAPQVLVDVDHSMSVMRDESFGPVVGIMRVDSDEEAVRLMNDSPYGLTASIWTSDSDAVLRLGSELEIGTCFMNRCDYLDPALGWTGVKNSGHGCTLSRIGYEHLTRPKSYHLKLSV
ncbi:MAG: short-chain dehydrogenase/reductase [Chlorobi bacterium]|nr:short-chain dehydrogenase/reductase [Chlorobiota bacterium]